MARRQTPKRAAGGASGGGDKPPEGRTDDEPTLLLGEPAPAAVEDEQNDVAVVVLPVEPSPATVTLRETPAVAHESPAAAPANVTPRSRAAVLPAVSRPSIDVDAGVATEPTVVSAAGARLVPWAPPKPLRGAPITRELLHMDGDDAKLDPRLLILRDPESPQAAAYRIVRHRLVDHGNPRIVLCTSALAEEGKTLTAVNLALSQAEFGRGRVLLLEANLMAPTLAAMFDRVPDAPSPEGLRIGSWTVFKRLGQRMDLLALAPNGATGESIDGTVWLGLMNFVRAAGYGQVVIDGPSVLGSADVNLIQDFTDGVLVVMWSRRSRAKDVRAAVEQISPARLVGTMLIEGL